MMPFDPKMLRKLFASGAVLAVMIAVGFYLHGIVKALRQPGIRPGNIPDAAKQVARGFEYSKFDGSKTLFTIRAASYEQFKEGLRIELRDASIILYGREGNRADQISGSDFQYDKDTGDVTANGEVNIDLEADSPVAAVPNSSSSSGKSTVHLKTSGLTFNEQTGLAQTKEQIEFQIPEASGSATGAVYDSRANVLNLNSAVRVVTTGRQKATVTAQSATILRAPQRIIMRGAKIDQQPRSVSTDQLTVMLRPDNTVERVLGAGAVHAGQEGPKGFDVKAGAGELILDNSSQLRSGTLSGGMTLAGRGESPAKGKAGRMLLSFGSKGRLEKARMEDAVELKQGTAAKSQEIRASAVDLGLRSGRFLDKATTSAGPAQISLAQKETKSTIAADQFEARFGQQNRLRSVFGTGNASIVSSTPGHVDQRSTSRDVSATFNAKREIVSAEQSGDFRYEGGDRKAWAGRARYNPVDDSYVLTGSPRVAKADSMLSADEIRFNRKTNGASAQGNVKTTYAQKAQSNGAMLGSGDPVHVTGASMSASQGSGTARYTAARLWRGQDIIEAPTMLFDHDHRSLLAESTATRRVSSVFVQPGKNGKLTPVNVMADKLSYIDADRKAVFSGNVMVTIEGGTIDADRVQVMFRPRNALDSQSTSQLETILAQGDIRIKQPNRDASGSQLVYTAAEERFVLTGSAARPPSILDAERGQISGDSLTFFTHDGRVLVGSGDSSHTLTQTKVQDASKK